MNVEFFSIFSQKSAGGHGGDHRLLQILELFARNGITYQLHVLPQSLPVSAKIRNILLGMLSIRDLPIPRLLVPRAIYNAGRIRTAIPEELVEGRHLFAIDSWICWHSANLDRLRDAGSKIVLLPHDLDSLSAPRRHPLTNDPAPLWLESEIAALAKGHVVCCISREEQWLLSVHGVPALYLPYYPPNELMQSLRLVRVKRQNAEEKNVVLVLGSADHTPNAAGLIALKPVLQAIPKAFPGTEVVIAGFGTGRHKQFFETEGVSVRGAVSNQAIEDLMVRSKCAIVSQAPHGGALTRIPEFLVAGVPIIANHHASRSYYNLEGVHTADCDDEIIDLLGNLRPNDPKMPDPPRSQEALLVKAILELQGTLETNGIQPS